MKGTTMFLETVIVCAIVIGIGVAFNVIAELISK